MKNKNILSLINAYRSCIMGVAALWVWYVHEWNPVLESVPGLSFLEGFIQNIGTTCVDFFFLLSGMGLIYAIEKYPVLDFYKRRLSRVYIPFLLIGIAKAVCFDWNIHAFLGNVLGIYFFTEWMYSLLWFVPAIIILYLIFPLFYHFFKKASSKAVFIYIFLVIWLFLSMKLHHTMRIDLYGFTNRIPIFLMGVLAGWYSKERDIEFTKLSWIACFATLFLGLYLAYLVNYYHMYLLVPESKYCVPNFLITLSSSCIMAKLFSYLDGLRFKLGKGFLKFLGFFGKISLEFYCVHEWVGGVIRGEMTGNFHNLLINLADFTLSTIAALLLIQICKLVRQLLSYIKPGKLRKAAP